MAFDAGPPKLPGAGSVPFQREPTDWADVVLRSVVLIPFIGLYTWLVISTVWNAIRAGFFPG
jgi:hypothetical protein